MTSPIATLTAQREFYIDALLSGEVKKFDDLECFDTDDVQIVFTARNANGNLVSLNGATVSLLIAAPNSTDLLSTKAVTVLDENGTVSFKLSEISESYTAFRLQLKITKDSKTVIAAFGKITASKEFE